MPSWFSRKAEPAQNIDSAVAQHGRAATAHMAAVFAALSLAVDPPQGKGSEHYFIHDPKACGDLYILGFVSGWAKAVHSNDKTIGRLSPDDFFGFVGTMHLKLFGTEHLRNVMSLSTSKALEPEFQNGFREGYQEALAELSNKKSPGHLLNYLSRRVKEGHYVPVE
jgi:hypothetical protein